MYLIASEIQGIVGWTFWWSFDC